LPLYRGERGHHRIVIGNVECSLHRERQFALDRPLSIRLPADSRLQPHPRAKPRDSRLEPRAARAAASPHAPASDRTGANTPAGCA
jgi:hypothetical protein